MPIKRGAGIIPYALYQNQLLFLFHRTFSGRRAGLLVDFGGGCQASETHQQTAAREFVEETEAMFLADDPERADLARHADAQIQTTLNLIRDTQQKHPEWWCKRVRLADKRPKDWKTFFVQTAYKDIDLMNDLWEQDTQQRYKKRRELVWVDSGQLLNIFRHQPEQLWTRLRQLDGVEAVIGSIEQGHRPILEQS